MAKGYFVSYGYKGYVNGRYMLFASDAEYLKYISEQDDRKEIQNEPESSQ